MRKHKLKIINGCTLAIKHVYEEQKFMDDKNRKTFPEVFFGYKRRFPSATLDIM